LIKKHLLFYSDLCILIKNRTNQNNKNEVLHEKEYILPCPECGQVAMKHVEKDCTLKDGTYIPNLIFLYCSSCQSKFYDNSAMEMIESFRQK